MDTTAIASWGKLSRGEQFSFHCKLLSLSLWQSLGANEWCTRLHGGSFSEHTCSTTIIFPFPGQRVLSSTANSFDFCCIMELLLLVVEFGSWKSLSSTMAVWLSLCRSITKNGGSRPYCQMEVGVIEAYTTQ